MAPGYILQKGSAIHEQMQQYYNLYVQVPTSQFLIKCRFVLEGMLVAALSNSTVGNVAVNAMDPCLMNGKQRLSNTQTVKGEGCCDNVGKGVPQYGKDVLDHDLHRNMAITSQTRQMLQTTLSALTRWSWMWRKESVKLGGSPEGLAVRPSDEAELLENGSLGGTTYKQTTTNWATATPTPHFLLGLGERLSTSRDGQGSRACAV
eukprot:2190352-Amphidinium_carterae.2